MRFVVILILSFLLFNCGKDKFTTKPQLKYTSSNSTTISGNQVLELKLELTDKEGDFTTLLGVKKSVSGCVNSNFTDSTKFIIPQDFIRSKGTHGEVVVTLSKSDRGSNACSAPGGGPRPDTTVFKFWTRDRAGNLSDTAYSETIIILN